MKVIYGENGAGKTTYAKMKGTDSFVIKHSVKDWFQNGIISHLNMIRGERKERIEILYRKLLGKNSSLLKKDSNLKVGNLKKYLRNIDFLKYENWFQYRDSSHIPMGAIKGNISILMNDKIMLKIKKIYHQSPEILDLLILYLQLSKMELKWENQSSNINRAVSALTDITESLKKATINIPEEILLLDPMILMEIREDGFRADASEKFIKQMIIYSPEFNEMKEMNNEYIKREKDAFRFNLDSSWKCIDEFSVDIGVEHSEGEATVKTMKVIIETLTKNDGEFKGEIILDDTLSNLDLENLRNIIEYILLLTAKITILTHDKNIYDLINEIADGKSITVIRQKIEWVNNKPAVTSILKPITPRDLIQMFLNDRKMKTNNVSLLIPRLFLRNDNKFGTLADNRQSQLIDTIGVGMFNWSSENIMHYEENVDYVNANRFLRKYGIILPRKMDSIILIKCILNRIIKEKKLKYKISKKKVIKFLEDIISYLTIEKKLLKNHSSNFSKSKSTFTNKGKRLNVIWDDKIAGCKKEDRNIFIHKIDANISHIIE